MRLINVESLVLEDFMAGGSDAPPYAILSHTWGNEEVTFQDFINPDQTVRSRKQGFAKISKTCSLAKSEGLKYAWVDTCCIDKTSSAELTEAINSMFQWYRDAVTCYAWLADLPSSAVVDGRPEKTSLSRCRWFTRGWTLQELIAPRAVQFFDQAWAPCGTKASIGEMLTEITMVNASVLEDPELLPTLSIAQRMSWAATRQTTRVEDMAYCLLGIFDVNMPMLYGEGSRAFLRLQEEIARESNDLSIFAWRATQADRQHSGVFAASPADFAQSGSVQLAGDTVYSPEFTLTNKGLRMNVNLYSAKEDAYLLKLNCDEVTATGQQSVGIFIKPHGGGVYSRARLSEFGVAAAGDTGKKRDLFLFRHLSAARSKRLETSHSNAFMLREGFNTAEKTPYPDFPFSTSFVMPMEEWDPQRHMFLTEGAAEFCGYALFVKRDGVRPDDELGTGSMFLVIFGKKGDQEAWVSLFDAYNHGPVFAEMYNVTNTLALVERMPRNSTLQMRNNMNNLTTRVGASIKKATVDGKVVHCVDLVYLKGPEAVTSWQDEGRRGSM
ncbi:HET domain-containingprotein [Purpureocillium lilacinum]|uniref:HET domain-containingprotein n=1 Tax=Purpureocillium lilacinum TaxID=33203 RepID=A0A179GG27_PURLI|nr:HET domain-containingprotein [Purpureocillium lilacinum]